MNGLEPEAPARFHALNLQRQRFSWLAAALGWAYALMDAAQETHFEGSSFHRAWQQITLGDHHGPEPAGASVVEPGLGRRAERWWLICKGTLVEEGSLRSVQTPDIVLGDVCMNVRFDQHVEGNSRSASSSLFQNSAMRFNWSSVAVKPQSRLSCKTITSPRVG